MTTLKVNVIRKPTIKVKVLPNFPSSVTATSPILLSKVGGNFSFSFDVNGFKAFVLTSLTLDATQITTGQLPIARGGTGQGAAGPAFDALAPTTTRGDLIARGAAVNARLALGTSGYHIQSNGTDPVWSGFLNPGTGGATRTWNTKAAEWVSVKDFGALGDNITNDTTAIQNAINSLTTGGTLYFPPGFYVISAALTITVQGVSLVGSNRLASIIRKTSATADILTITGAYARIDNLGLIGTAATVSTAGYAINASVNSCVFTNLFISDVWGGIILTTGTNILVQAVKMLNLFGSYGINISSGGGNYIIDNQLDPVFYGPYTMASGFGAWAATTAYTLNQVRSANGGYFVCTQAGTSTTGAGPVITAFNTTIVDGTARWLFICSSTSIGLGITANSNYCAYNDISGPWGAGISIATADGNIIQANTVGQIIGAGINLGANATNTLVQSNLVSGAYGTFSYAIGDGNGSATGTRFLNNLINGSGWMGIIVQSANCIVNDNWITGTSQLTGSYGIEVVANVNNFTINNNTIIITAGMNGPVKVAAGTSDNYKIMGNQTGTGVNLDGGTGNNKTVDPSFGVGYAAGAGGAVTQLTSRVTGVTLNKVSGAITLVSAAGVNTAATAITFTVTNSAVAATDTVILSQKSGADKWLFFVTAVAAGSFAITGFTTAGTTTEQPVINFNVIKGVAA